LLEDTATTRSKKTTGAAPINARNTAYLLGIGLPLVAIVLYMRIGEPDRITNPAPVGAPPSAAAAAPPERTQEQIEANVAKLAERLKSSPNDAQGWTMLARSYSSMEKYSEAANAYAKATELNPKDADLLAEYAFVTGMAEGRSLEGEAVTHHIVKARNIRQMNKGGTWELVTTLGYRNEEGQVVVARTGRTGDDPTQRVFVMRCSVCNHEYGTYGSDIPHRCCPRCQDGLPGLPL